MKLFGIRGVILRRRQSLMMDTLSDSDQGPKELLFVTDKVLLWMS